MSNYTGTSASGLATPKTLTKPKKAMHRMLTSNEVYKMKMAAQKRKMREKQQRKEKARENRRIREENKLKKSREPPRLDSEQSCVSSTVCKPAYASD